MKTRRPKRPGFRGFATRLAFRIAALAISAVICFAVLEIGTRIYVSVAGVQMRELPTYFINSPTSDKKWDDELGWSLRPGFVGEKYETRINQSGLRSSLELDAPRSGKKILVLGDSMVYGIGATQSEIFTEVFNREHPDDFMVNTGVEGYSTAQAYLVQKKISPIVQPDVGVMFFTQANDLWFNARDDYFYASFDVEGDELVYRAPRRENNLPLYKRTALYRLSGLTYDLHYLRDRLELKLRGENMYAWRVTRRLIQEMKAIADEQGYPMILIDIPTRRQFWARNEERPRQIMLQEAAEEFGMHYVDLRDHYPANTERFIIPGDTHWNAEGHRFIADLLDEILAEYDD